MQLMCPKIGGTGKQVCTTAWTDTIDIDMTA